MCWVVCEVLGTPETRGIILPHSGGVILSPVSSFSFFPPFHSHGSATVSVRSHQFFPGCLLWEYKQTTLA